MRNSIRSAAPATDPAMRRDDGRRIGIAGKFNLLAIGLVLVASVAITAWLVRAQIRDSRRELLDRGRAVAAILARNCEFGIRTQDPNILRPLLEGVDHDPVVTYAALYDRDGRLMAAHRKSPACPAPQQRIFPEGRNEWSFRDREYVCGSAAACRTDRCVDLLTPVFAVEEPGRAGILSTAGKTGPANPVAYLQLGLSEKLLAQRTRRYVSSAVLATGLLVCVGALLSFLMTRRIASPIRKLVEVTRSVSDDNLDQRIEIDTRDEIRDLKIAFEQMLARLAESRRSLTERTRDLQETNDRMGREIGERYRAEKALKKAQEELEARIAERTVELSDANRLLKEEVFERLQAEEALRESNDTLHALIQGSPLAIVVIDPDRHVTLWNPAAERIFGWSAEEVMEDPSLIIPPDTGELAAKVRRAAARGEGISGLEIRLRRKDGETIDINASLAPILNANGGVVGLMGILADITERKRAEGELARLALAVEQTGESIVVTDAEGTIRYVNPAFERVSGWSREEVVGRNPRILSSGKHEAMYYRKMWETLLRGDTWTGNLINRRRDGKLFEEMAVISPVRDASGRIVNFVAVKRDVTYEVQMEEQLRQAQKMEAVGKLAGGVAHDFNNLLTAITGYGDLLFARIPEGEPARREVDEIRKAADRASALTRQLLAFSRKQVLQPKVVNLNDVVSNMDAMLRRLIGEDIELEATLREDLWSVRVDPGQTEQVILNLAVNARDAMPGGGRLSLETQNVVLDESHIRSRVVVRPGPYVVLTVSDTGSGMDEGTQSRIFEPFFTTKEQGKGTGLGLSTVYGIVKQSQGYIWVFSEPSKGTTFKIYLPRAEQEASPEPAPPEEHADHGTVEAGTILLAEDEELVRELVAEILRGSGYSVLSARDGEEALQLSERHGGSIDLLVTDVVMPRMNGRLLAERVRERRPEVRVIFMSGYTEDAIIQHGVLDAGTEFIQKPFRLNVLARRVRDILGEQGSSRDSLFPSPGGGTPGRPPVH